MKFTLTLPEKDLNTIITALRIEQNRVIEEGNTDAIACIKSALEAVNNNTCIANAKDIKKRRR